MNRRNFLLGSAATLTAAGMSTFNLEQAFETFVEYFAQRKFYAVNVPTIVQWSKVHDALIWTTIPLEELYNTERMQSNV